MMVDTHAHLQVREFRHDWPVVVEKARAADVHVILTVGTSVESSRAAVEIAEGAEGSEGSESKEGIFAAVGVHPNELGEAPADWVEKIRELARHPKVKAIGESGMDLYRKHTPEDLQREALVKHLELARELDLPIILHSRAAGEQVMDVVEELAGGRQTRGVMHCFTEHEPIMRRAVKAGLHISFAGPLTYPISRRARELMKKVPDSRLLVETDSPYLGAQPVKHRRNEPAYVRYVATKVSEMRRISPRDVNRITTLNADNLFGLGVADRETRIVYGIRSFLYLNITNRCPNRCTFCPRVWGEEPDEGGGDPAGDEATFRRENAYIVKGHNLRLEREPTVDELLAAMGSVEPYRGVVFCGFGEPTMRLDVVLEVAGRIRAQGQRVRLDTNGQGSLVHGRSIVPELAEVVDAVSVSLNAATPEEYVEHCRPEKGEAAFEAVVDFVKEAKGRIPEVTVTAVGLPGLDMAAVRRLAKDLGVRFRLRKYNSVG